MESTAPPLGGAAAEGGNPMSRTPNSGREAEPMAASVRGIILIVVALVIGIFILSKVKSGGTVPTSVSSQPKTATTKPAKGKETTTSTPPSTRAVRQPAAIKVLAANGSGVPGLGGKTGDKLTAAGYNSLAPTNTTTDVATTAVEFTPGFDLEALYVAQALGIQATSVKPLAPDIPVEDTKGADIVVLVGPDLATTAPAGGSTTPTTAFPVTTTR